MSEPSLADIKTYLGITGSGDDTIIANALSSAVSQAERDTGRTFSYTSNNTRTYSSDGQTLVTIRDIPRTDASRVVTLAGVTLTETEGYWLLPDRRNPDISVTLQLRPFDRRGDWYKNDPNWFFKNLDNYPTWGAQPNDVVVAGFEGHPTWANDVVEEVRFLAAWFYWRAKSGASGVVQLPGGQEVDLGAEPVSGAQFVANWRVRQAVSSVG